MSPSVAVGESSAAAMAKTAIAAGLPQFKKARVKFLGQGCDFRVYEVGAQWLFRFPKHAGAARKLKMELRLLDDLGKRLPLPVPNYEYSRESANPRRWFGAYRKIPGTPADRSPTVSPKEAASQLGAFLHQLHSYSVDLASEVGVPEVRNAVCRSRKRALSELRGLTDLSVDADDLRLYLESESPNLGGAFGLVHNDLWAEHILVNDGGGVSGVIDWGDAVIGDPAIDFAGLYAWQGERWLEQIIDRYPGNLDSATLARARYLAACQAVHYIALGQDLGRKSWLKAGDEALRRVFAARAGQAPE